MGNVMLKKWYAKVIFFILYSFASHCMMQLFLDANPFTIGVNGIARNMFLFMVYYGVLLCFFRKMRPALLFGGILMILIEGSIISYCNFVAMESFYGFLRYFYGDDSGGAVYR